MQTPSGFGVETGLALLGLLAVALPFLLERLRRRRARPIAFPALRFLLQQQARFHRLLTFQRSAVVVLRALAMLFLVLFFARPYLRSAARLGKGVGPDTAAVIVVDNSPVARVGLGEDGRSVLEAERELVDGFIRDKAPDAVVAVAPLVSSRRGAELGVVFEADIDSLLSRVEALDLDSRAATPGALFEGAARALRQQPTGGRVIYWVSPRYPRELVAKAAEAPWADLRFIPVHPAPDQRLHGPVIRALDVSPGSLRASLENLSPAPFEGTIQLLRPPRRVLYELSLSLKPWEARELTLSVPQGSPFLAEVRLSPDAGLARYQRRFFRAGGGQRMERRAFLLRSETPPDRAGDPLFYVQSALRTLGRLQPYAATPEDTRQDPPRQGDWVIRVVEGAELVGAGDDENSAIVRETRAWLEAGVRVWLVLASEPPPNQDFMGLTLIGRARGASTGFEAGPWLEPELAECLSTTETAELLLATGYRAAGYEALVSSRDGLPLLLGRRFGAGYLLLDASDLTPQSTDLCFQPCFSAWVGALIERVEGATMTYADAVFEEGDLLDSVGTWAAGGEASLVQPDGQTISLGSAPLCLSEPGWNRLRLADEAGITTRDLAVNPRLSFDADSLRWPEAASQRAGAEAADTFTTWRRVDLSGLFLFLALLVLIPEALMSAVALRRQG